MFNTILILLLANSAPNAVPAKPLAIQIIRTAAAYGINAETLTRILLTESKGVATAENKRTGDYGIMQINHRTAASYKLSQECLKNWKCNLAAGAAILKDMQKSKHYRTCAYNVGTSHIGTRMKSCLTYETKLAIL